MNSSAKTLTKSIFKGVLAFVFLLSVYFLILSLVSGWTYTLEQFGQYWYYVVTLAIGFGIQLTLYSYLRAIARQQASRGQIVTTGATSTAAMISCCAHYLTNILPILGVAGIITFISQYQIQFFWVGLIFNLFGIIYIGNKVVKFTRPKVKIVKLFYSLSLVAIIIFFFLNTVSVNITPESTNSASRNSQNNNGLAAQENDEGAVSVSVTPQSLKSKTSTWNFDVGLNTHSGSIDIDLVTASELVDDKGNSFKPTAWEGSPPSGHHRNGVLKFNPISPIPKFIELKIHDVDGVSVRSFKWTL